MKRVNMVIFAAMTLILAALTGCSDDSNYDAATLKYTPTPEPEKTEPAKKDSTYTVWGTVVDKSFGFNEPSNTWPSTITVEGTKTTIVNGKTTETKVDTTFIEDLPFSYRWTGSLEHITSLEDATTFVSIETIALNKGEYAVTERGNFVRRCEALLKVSFNTYKDTLELVWHEAYRMINGRREAFLSSEPQLQKRPSEFNNSAARYVVERGENKYEVESVDTKWYITFDKYEFNPSRLWSVLRQTNEPVSKPEEMPTPTIKVKNLVVVETATVAPIYSGDKIASWHLINIVETTTEYIVVVDGIEADRWAKEDLADVHTANKKNYTSAIYDDGKWVPALITPGQGGDWSYAIKITGEDAKVLNMPSELARTTGCPSFTGSNRAMPTYQAKSTFTTKEYNGKKYILCHSESMAKEITKKADFSVGEVL